MANDVLLDLVTQLSPPKKFKVDGAEYVLYGIDHLSDDDEAKAMALFARHSLLAQEIELTANTRRGAELALRLKACRVRILCTLTSITEEVARKLPTAAQASLLEAIQKELSVDDEDARLDTLNDDDDEDKPKLVEADHLLDEEDVDD